MAFVLAFLVTAALTGALLRTVARWRGFALPLQDLLFIVALCGGIALLPSVGWVLAMLIMSLLLLRTTDADAWPDTVVAVTASGLIWLVINLGVFSLWF